MMRVTGGDRVRQNGFWDYCGDCVMKCNVGWAAVSVLLIVSGSALASGEARDEDEQARSRERVQQELMARSCRDLQGRPESWLDRSHSYLNRRLCEPAAWFDGFFGDPRSLEENPVGTFFRLRNLARWDEDGGLGYRLQVRANVILPRLSERVRLLVARDEDLSGEFSDSAAFDRDDDRTRLGLRFIASDKARSRFDVDGTVRLSSSGLNPRVRGRYRYVRGLSDRTLSRFTQVGFWEREDGFGTTTRLDWEWLPDRDRLVRWTGQGTFSEASQGVDWRSSAVAFQQLDHRTAVRAEIGAFGYTRPSFQTEEYFVALRIRRQFLRRWLFYELQPEHAWPKDFETGHRRADWRFTLTLEVQFENERSRQRRLQRYLDEDEDPELWEDRPVPVEAPGDQADDPVLGRDRDESGDNDKSGEGGG